jgi:hypothetical protein
LLNFWLKQMDTIRISDLTYLSGLLLDNIFYCEHSPINRLALEQSAISPQVA